MISFYEKERMVAEPTPKVQNVFVPQIEEIKVIMGEDGEEYINLKDLTIAMRMIAYNQTPTLSVLNFIKRLVIELITARR